MKRYLLILLALLVLVTSLCSCGLYTNEEEQTDEGVYYSLSDTLSTSIYMRTEFPEYGADVEKITLFFGHEGGSGFKFDGRYVMYFYEDGEWQKIPFKSSFMCPQGVFELEPALLGPSETYEYIKLSDLNIKLKPGRYKVQKEFEDGSAYAEFVIK